MALNEAAFRVANERMRGWEERHQGGDAESYYCECVDPDCHDRVSLTLERYEAIRADSTRFLVVPGHERTEVEDVVERHPDLVVVQKHANTAPLVERTDPRT